MLEADDVLSMLPAGRCEGVADTGLAHQSFRLCIQEAKVLRLEGARMSFESYIMVMSAFHQARPQWAASAFMLQAV